MFFFYSRTWTARVQGESWRVVDCVKCGRHFEYPVVIEGKGRGESAYGNNDAGAERVATERALANLEAKLDRAPIPIPCPGCGDYQPDMIDAMKQEKFPYLLEPERWMLWAYIGLTVVILAVCTGLSFLPNANKEPLRLRWYLFMPWGLVTVLAAAVCVQAIRRRVFDPYQGSTAEERMAYAEQKTVPHKPMALPILTPIFDEEERRATPIYTPIIDE